MTSHYKGVAARKVVEAIQRRNAEQPVTSTTPPPDGRGQDIEKKEIIDLDQNLTDQQRELLRLLVQHDESRGGEEFIVTRDTLSTGIRYSAGFSMRVAYTLSDFKQLQIERLITFYLVSGNVWRGKPTQLGITHIRAERGPTTEPAPELRPAPVAVADESTKKRAAPKLNVKLIDKWMEDEGYDNKGLAAELKISVRTVSSLRNNGGYHGADAVTRLANLMNRDVEELYLP